MTTKQFWQSASNRGFLCGAALFAINVVGWALKLEATGSWYYELLLFIVICPFILYTGRRNAALAGPEGYPYSRAVGYVFATMLFAGIVYGVGRYLMVNFIARDYYDALNATALEAAIKMYQGTPLESQMAVMRDQMLGMLSNPFMIIFQSVFGLVCKGGFLGLILGAFIYKKPDIFASVTPQDNDNEQSSR